MTRFAVGLIAGALALLALLASAHQGDASAPAGVHLTMTGSPTEMAVSWVMPGNLSGVMLNILMSKNTYNKLSFEYESV